ncbi:MAG TPA: M50 family metallopeptidase [Gemmatimonadales bacterium]|nr:M50 family metallopeptidase [Gemmatimonadales bacterium]
MRERHHHDLLWLFTRLPYPVRVVTLVFLAAWVALALHELAHALVARLLGIRVWEISLGRGPVVWEGMVRGCRVRLALLPLHGAVRLDDRDAHKLGYRGIGDAQWAFEWLAGSSWRAPLITAAGSVANLLAAKAVIAYWSWMPHPAPPIFSLSACIFIVNAMMFLNLVPIRGLDGWRMAVQTAAWRRAPRLQRA